MAKHDNIAGIRFQVDPVRQPRHAATLARFLERLSMLDPADRDPFQLGGKAFNLLLDDKDFSQTPPGLPAAIASPAHGDENYWYRITSVRKMIKNTGPRLLDGEDRDSANFAFLWIDFEQEKSWLPLSRYVTGNLTGPRGFTWWSNVNPFPEIVCSAHKVGVLNEWVTYHTVIMRLKASDLRELNIACVPTIIHAFDSLIFHAVQEQNDPTTGLALNLEQDPLEVEHAEVVAFSVPVRAIECIPILVDSTQREKHQVNYESILDRLLNYYQRLLQES